MRDREGFKIPKELINLKLIVLEIARGVKLHLLTWWAFCNLPLCYFYCIIQASFSDLCISNWSNDAILQVYDT